jgi:hypothetical protein
MNRTGVNPLSSGLDADAINKTARGAVLAQNQQAQKIELIARIFAETGIKDLFKGILRLIYKYHAKPMMIRLDNKFVPVDPRNWDTEWDLTVTVGLGTGDKEQQLMHLQMIAALQEKMVMAGMSHVATTQNIYNTASKFVENAGYKHVEEFFTNPEGQQPPQPPPDPAVIKAQADMQMTQMKLQADQQKSIGEASVEKLLKEIEAQAQISVAQIQAQTQLAIKQMELAAESAMKDKEIRADAELKVFEENNKATIKQAELEDKDKDRALQAAVQNETLKREDQKLKIEDKKVEQPKQIAQKEQESAKKLESVLADVVKSQKAIEAEMKKDDKEMEAVVEQLKSVQEALGKKAKRISIKAPSGNTYEATVD